MRFNKSDLIRKLESENIFISDDDLDEVINIYNFYLEILKEFYFKSNYDYFKNTSATPEFHFSNLKSLVILQQKGMLHYVDLVLVLNYIIEGLDDGWDSVISPSDIVEDFHGFLASLIHLERQHQECFSYRYYKLNNDAIEIVAGLKNKIRKSKYVSKEYKDIINKFSKLFEIEYKDDIKFFAHENYKVIFKSEYVNCIYHYFVMNKILINDLERASNFLDYLIKNVQIAIEEINIVGITYENREAIFYYIDSMYKCFDSKAQMIK